jgi:hypothetical protein
MGPARRPAGQSLVDRRASESHDEAGLATDEALGLASDAGAVIAMTTDYDPGPRDGMLCGLLNRLPTS